MNELVVNAPSHPARNVNIENKSVPVGNERNNPLSVGGSGVELLCELLHQLLEEQRLANELLKEIGK